jgi:hypothetical protein
MRGLGSLKQLRQLIKEPDVQQLLSLVERASVGFAAPSAAGVGRAAAGFGSHAGGAAAARLYSSMPGRNAGAAAQLHCLAARHLARGAPRLDAAALRRLFSTEGPRRGWEKFYPKGKPRRPAAQGKGAKGEAGRAA